MRASLDTNAIIHFYKAECQNILFDFFKDGVFIYEQIRNIELENHGKDVIEKVDADIRAGKIVVFTDQYLKDKEIFRIFQGNVNENRWLYGKGDLGEVYAISLAQTIGAYTLVTDDIKQGGPYMSLLQFEDEVTPLTFADVIILRYLTGSTDESQVVKDFEAINTKSELNWSLKGQVVKFIKRFVKEPYREEERRWLQSMTKDKGISIKQKFSSLSKLI